MKHNGNSSVKSILSGNQENHSSILEAFLEKSSAASVFSRHDASKDTRLCLSLNKKGIIETPHNSKNGSINLKTDQAAKFKRERDEINAVRAPINAYDDNEDDISFYFTDESFPEQRFGAEKKSTNNSQHRKKSDGGDCSAKKYAHEDHRTQFRHSALKKEHGRSRDKEETGNERDHHRRHRSPDARSKRRHRSPNSRSKRKIDDQPKSDLYVYEENSGRNKDSNRTSAKRPYYSRSDDQQQKPDRPTGKGSRANPTAPSADVSNLNQSKNASSLNGSFQKQENSLLRAFPGMITTQTGKQETVAVKAPVQQAAEPVRQLPVSVEDRIAAIANYRRATGSNRFKKKAANDKGLQEASDTKSQYLQMVSELKSKDKMTDMDRGKWLVR